MTARFSEYACYRCGHTYPATIPIDSLGCPACFDSAPSNLRVSYRAAEPVEEAIGKETMLPSLWRYARRLPFDAGDAVSLGEGLTPLLAIERLGAEIGVPNLSLKNESCNPTWSHKDRFSTVAVTAAMEVGASVVATSSTGNAGASLAAYAARAGLPCIVATLAGSAGPMLAQIEKYGARIVPFVHKQDRWRFLEKGVEQFGWFATSPYRHPVVGSHPIGIEGYKTIAFEIVEQMHGTIPDWCALPVCYGDALAGVWLGFRELVADGEIDRMPRLLAAEVHGSLAAALQQDTDRIPDMTARFDTLAVSVGATRSTYQALKALRETNGAALPVTNQGLIETQEKIAATEGVFLELASVMPITAIAAARRQGMIQSGDTVVAIVTASGLKDIDKSATNKEQPAFVNADAALEFIAAQEGETIPA